MDQWLCCVGLGQRELRAEVVAWRVCVCVTQPSDRPQPQTPSLLHPPGHAASGTLQDPSPDRQSHYRQAKMFATNSEKHIGRSVYLRLECVGQGDGA